MGLSGCLAYFRETPITAAKEVIPSLLEYAEIVSIISASRFRDLTLPSLRELRGEIEAEYRDPHEGRSSLRRPNVGDAIAFFREGENFAIFAWESGVQIKLDEAIKAIDPKIRGDWVIGSMLIEVGPHELFEAVGTPKYFGHAEVSVRFSGSGSPRSWPLCRRMVLELPEIKAFAKGLEPILGEVKTCVYWDG